MLKAKWSIEPGDGTGGSIADALVRNSNGLCAVMDCGKPMNRKNEYTIFGGILCNDCHKDWKSSLEDSLLELRQNIDCEIVGVVAKELK